MAGKEHKRKQRPESPAHGGNTTSQEIKDTTESIVIAFILAFVFRAFVVEAFIIPTGSMAATLYGRHGTLVCEDCGWENAYGLSDPLARANLHGPDSKVRCQNCDHLNTNLKIHDGVNSRLGGRRIVRGNSESGDRILVFKWPLDIGGEALGPKRWDVTVFKNPADGNENFIKRLIGLPNEVLEIIDGDIYTVPTAELSEETLDILEQLRHIKYRQRTGAGLDANDAMRLRQPPPQSVLDELAEKLRIQAKTQEAQQSHRMVVYNHDYPPRTWNTGQPRWEPLPASGPTWSADDRRLTFSGVAGGKATVTYSGKRIVDHNAYNIDVPPSAWNPVSDLRLEFVLYPKGGDGYIETALFKGDDCFVARLQADGRVSLTRQKGDDRKPELLSEAVVPPLEPQRPIELVFQNIDYRVSLAIDGQDVLATTTDQYAPDIRYLRGSPPRPALTPRITAAEMSLELWHVVLYRDEYYTSPTLANSVFRSRLPGWGTSKHPILLREGEYFMLGDNSPASKDSRLWDAVGGHLADRGEDFQLGTVPRDQLVGQAFFVYWPSGLRPDWLPGRGEHLVEHFVPNVGRMRWIR